ncbi:MAG: hypothetical protein BGO01_07560 [Armatimonadetes bacterium 55-13]|nr:DUF1905 domain-containing protein [Armatimonadota bacterium]OJU63717.1 MAG: hypothetical protein BGO01_07560 [Armatimonadetes bacterium 55-13]
MKKFRATLDLHGKSATGISVPESVVVALGKGKRPKVTVTINGYSYRTTVAPMGGEYLIPVSAEVREKARITAGQRLEVELALDDAPRKVEVPDDFQHALDANVQAQKCFENLSYSNKRKFVLNVEGAKSAETRARRIEKFVEQLANGKI